MHLTDLYQKKKNYHVKSHTTHQRKWTHQTVIIHLSSIQGENSHTHTPYNGSNLTTSPKHVCIHTGFYKQIYILVEMIIISNIHFKNGSEELEIY